MSQFAILTSEGWTETMYETMKAARENSEYQLYAYFMPIYFIFSHMFCSLVNLEKSISEEWCLLDFQGEF